MVWAAALSSRSCWVLTPQPDGAWRYCSNVLGVEAIEQERLVRAAAQDIEGVAAFCATHEIGAVAAADTRGSRFLLRAAPSLPRDVNCFPMCETELFERMYDKWGFATLLRELSLPAPSTELIRSREDIERSSIEMPAILKPTQGESSVGVEKIGTPAAARASVNARLGRSEGPFILQQFIPGVDIDLSLLCDRGSCVAWTIQQRAGGGTMRFLDHPVVLELGRTLVRETGYHGVMHLDMRIDERDGKVLFIESNPRFWGSLNYSVWSGVNFLDLGLRMLEGAGPRGHFTPVVTECPYLDVTKRSLPRALLGGWPVPRGLSDAQRRAWCFHHRYGSGAIRGLLRSWVA
ncbi:MAG: ATP-grasp domain-containing protein [Candidatus Parcubacteria bacterium]|nr:ATP-grasp domain-containing protein [Burkholderiales bacterium]